MTLKVFDLQCDQNHVFEGWFGSHADYESQQARGLVSCPVCASAVIHKKLSAPRLNVSGAQAPAGEGGPAASGTDLAHQQGELLRRLREAVRSCENVGSRFADEARRIHEGDSPARAIRGTASRDEREALAADGIGVMPIPDLLDDDRLQ